MKQKKEKGKIVIERKDGHKSWNDEGKIDGCASFTIKGNTIKGKGRVSISWSEKKFDHQEKKSLRTHGRAWQEPSAALV